MRYRSLSLVIVGCAVFIAYLDPPATAAMTKPEQCKIALSKLLTKQYTAAIKCAEASTKDPGKFSSPATCWTARRALPCRAAFKKYVFVTGGRCPLGMLAVAATMAIGGGCTIPENVPFLGLSASTPNPIAVAWAAYQTY